MRFILFFVLFVLFVVNFGRASETVTATINIVTNPHPGSVISITGVGVTWTNDTPASANWVLTTNSPANATTNLFIKLSSLEWTNVNGFEYANETNLTVYGQIDVPLVITVSGPGGTNWASVTYSTNQSFIGYALSLPIFSSNDTNEWTNIVDDVVETLNFTGASERLAYNASAFTNVPHQNRVSQPPLTNQPLYSAALVGGSVSNASLLGGTMAGAITATDATVTGGTNVNGTLTTPTLTAASVTGGTNSGTFYNTNATSLGGTNEGVTLVSPTVTGAATFNGASLALDGTGVNDFISIQATTTVLSAVGPVFVMKRNRAGTNVDADHLLGTIVWTGYGDTGNKVGARISAFSKDHFTDSHAPTMLALGVTPTNATATAFILYLDETGVIVSNHMVVRSNLTVAIHSDLTSAQIDNLLGSNWLSGTLSRQAGAVTTLTTSNNVLSLGTNEVYSLSGAAGVPNIVGITNSWNGRQLLGFNNNGTDLNLVYEYNDGGPVDNRITWPGGTAGAHLTIPDGGWFFLRHDASRWRVVFPQTSGITNLSVTTGSILTNTGNYGINSNDFTLDQYYTNAAGRSWVSAVVHAPSGAQASLWLDQDADGTWERTGITATNTMQLGAFLQPNARFLFTNQAGSPAINANSSQWVTQ